MKKGSMQMKVQALNMLLNSISTAKLLPGQYILSFLCYTKPMLHFLMGLDDIWSKLKKVLISGELGYCVVNLLKSPRL